MISENPGTVLDFDTVTGFLNLQGLNFVFKRITISLEEKAREPVNQCSSVEANGFTS